MGSIQDAIEIISREVELQEPSSSADFNAFRQESPTSK